MNNQQTFGPWAVEKTIEDGRAYEVTHPDREGAFVLKQAPQNDNEMFQRQNIMQIHNEIEVYRILKDHPNFLTMVDCDKDGALPYHVTKKVDAVRYRQAIGNYPLDKLDTIGKKIQELIRIFGYCHSQGITLNGDIEICITNEDEFIIMDLEQCAVFPNHHVDTSDDLTTVAGIVSNFKDLAATTRKQKAKQRVVERLKNEARADAQPSAPRRLAAE